MPRSNAMTEVLVQPAAQQTADAEPVFGNQALRSQLRQLDARLAGLESLEPAPSVVPRSTSASSSRAVTFLPGAPSSSLIINATNFDKPLVEPLLVQKSVRSEARQKMSRQFDLQAVDDGAEWHSTAKRMSIAKAADDAGKLVDVNTSQSRCSIYFGGFVEGLCICAVLGFWVYGATVAVQSSSEYDCRYAVIAFWILFSTALVLMTCCGLWGLSGHARGVIVGFFMAAMSLAVAGVFTWYAPLVPATCNTQLSSGFLMLAGVHWGLAAVFAVGAIVLHYIHMAHQAAPQSDDHALLKLARKARSTRHDCPIFHALTHLPRMAEEVTDLLKRDHAIFWGNLRLAFVAAFWMTLFAAPICCNAVYTFLFGSEATATIDGEEVLLCDPWLIGRYVNKAAPGMEPDLQRWKEGDVWNPDDPSMVDCGIVFKSYLQCWPLVVQMLVYTIYHNTGSTVRLAWQGFAGTFVAVLNLYVMMMILPNGAKAHVCTDEEVAQKLCIAGSLLYDDPNYPVWGIWLCWFDVIFLLFLFLISTAPKNLIQFGMSYHVFFMMDFMNHEIGFSPGHHPTPIPGVQWDSTGTSTLIAVALGCSLSVVITYMPIPLLNITHLDRDAKFIVNSVRDIWRLSIVYFCGPAKTEMEYRIKSRIQTLDEPLNSYATHLNDSWWEALDIGHFGRKRALYGVFIDYARRYHQTALQATISTADFGEIHRCFCNTEMREVMLNLNTAAANMMDQVMATCKAGWITENEKAVISRAIDVTRELQEEMLQKYNDIMESMNAEQHAVRQLSHESMFCFCLSAWSRRCMNFAEEVLNDEAEVPSPGRTVCCSCVNVFALEQIWDRDHLKFCFRNLTSISLCYFLGFYLPAGLKGTVFKPYSAAMPNALALLISRKQLAAFKMSITRLLSVTLGKVLPILAMSLVGILPPDHPLRPVVHMMIIFAYMFLFEYMYLTSNSWSSLGCNIAAFGATFLYSRSTSYAAVDFTNRYEEIAQVVAAVLIQMLVDTALREKSSRQHAMVAITAWTASFYKSFTDLGNLELEDMQHQLVDLTTKLRSVKEWIPEVDPSMQLIASWRVPFRQKLFESACHCFDQLLGDLRTMLLALADEPGKACNSSIMQRQPAFNKVYREFINMFSNVVWLLLLILDQDDETPISQQRALEMEHWPRNKELQGLRELEDEMNELISSRSGKDTSSEFLCEDLRIRCPVLVRSLQNGTFHLMKLLAECLQEPIYEDQEGIDDVL